MFLLLSWISLHRAVPFFQKKTTGWSSSLFSQPCLLFPHIFYLKEGIDRTAYSASPAIEGVPAIYNLFPTLHIYCHQNPRGKNAGISFYNGYCFLYRI